MVNERLINGYKEAGDAKFSINRDDAAVILSLLATMTIMKIISYREFNTIRFSIYMRSDI